MIDERLELAERLLRSFEDEGAIPKQIYRIISSPEIVRGTISCADGEADYVRKRVREKAKVEIGPRSNIVDLPPVISCGESGDQLTSILDEKGITVGELAQAIIQNSEFVSSSGVTYKPVMVIGDQFSDNIVTSNVQKFAVKMKYVTPPVELAPLLRMSISNEEMERLGLLWIIVMHRELVGAPGLLGLDRSGGVRLHAYVGGASRRWLRKTGFVYLAPQEK